MYFGMSELGISYQIMTITFPIVTFLIYAFTTFELIKKLKIKSPVSGIYLTEFPKKLTIGIGLIVITIHPITNLLYSKYAERIYEIETIDIHSYLSFYSWFQIGFGISRLLILIILIIVFVNHLNKLNGK
jgi:hypothetical protein